MFRFSQVAGRRRELSKLINSHRLSFFFFLSLLKNAIQEARPNTYLNTTPRLLLQKAKTADLIIAFLI